MTTEPIDEQPALDDIPEDADDLVGDEVEPEHDLDLDPPEPDVENVPDFEEVV